MELDHYKKVAEKGRDAAKDATTTDNDDTGYAPLYTDSYSDTHKDFVVNLDRRIVYHLRQHHFGGASVESIVRIALQRLAQSEDKR